MYFSCLLNNVLQGYTEKIKNNAAAVLVPNPGIYSFIHSFIYPLIHLPIHLLFHLFIHPGIYSFISRFLHSPLNDNVGLGSSMKYHGGGYKGSFLFLPLNFTGIFISNLKGKN